MQLSGQSAAEASRPVLTEEPNYAAVCKAALAGPLPPTAAEAAQQAEETPSTCNEEDAYYGFAKAPDYREALSCAYRHRAKPNPGSFVAGAGTLTMLYANGYGVPRDYDLAIRFACELNDLGAAQAETEYRIGRLEALRDGKLPADKPFDLCDDATSGALGSYCEWITQKKADVGRARRLQELQAQLSERAQAQLQELEAAEAAFEKARGKGEYTGGGGSGSAGFEQLDQGQLREQFLINLKRFAAGDLPKATSADRAQAEREVQAAFAAAVENAQPPNTPNRNLGAPDPDKASLGSTQHAWEALFAAWMRFVPIAYPQLAPDSAATELLRLRKHQLQRVAQ